jgi:hypothetical protein
MAHYPDPDVTIGVFRILPQTDGGYVIVDTRRPPGRRTVGKKFKKLKDAVATAKAWHEQGHG